MKRLIWTAWMWTGGFLWIWASTTWMTYKRAEQQYDAVEKIMKGKP